MTTPPRIPDERKDAMSGDETTEVIRDAQGRISAIKKPPGLESRLAAAIERLAEAMANGGASRIAPLVGLNEAEARRAADRARETIRDLRDEVDFTEAVAEALAARTFAAGVKAGLAATMREVAPERTAQVVIPPEAAATALETALREITEQVEAMRRAEETAPPALPSGD